MKKINFKKSIVFLLFLFFLKINLNYLIADSKIYLDLSNVKFENDSGYKSHDISSQLIINMDLKKEIEGWVKEKIVLKGNSGNLKIRIIEEKIFDNFVTEHSDKFSFLPKDGISYKIFFKVVIIAENNKHNTFGKIEASVKGDKTFLGGFSINERSKSLEEVLKKMIKKLETNMEKEINNQFKDFITNKYN